MSEIFNKNHNHFDNQDDESLQENKSNSFIKIFDWCKRNIYTNTICYYIFAIISFVIIPISLFLLHNPKIDVEFIGLPFGIGFGIALMMIIIITKSTAICILSLFIFIFLIVKKKFQPVFFLVPFIIIFLLVNSAILSIYRDYYIISGDFNLKSILFFIQFNYLFLPLAYIPFAILFTIITVIMYINHIIPIKRTDLK